MALFILCTTVLACMSGCSSKYADNLNKIFETEYFRCISYDDQHVTILSLSEKGIKQTEYLIIPKEINGMDVTTLGGEIKGSAGFGIVNRARYRFYPRAKKVYFEGRNYILENCQFDTDAIILSQFYESEFINKLAMGGYTICSYKNNQFEKFLLADIVYLLNYREADDVYCINNSEKDIWINPPAPMREGYIFDGWYLEKECENKFYSESIYLGTEINYLYAKWIVE